MPTASTKTKAPEDKKSARKTNGKAVRNRGQRTRQAILDKATELLVENGYDALVLRDLASQVGIKLGNLQYYFPTKEDLLFELSQEFFEKQSLEIDELFNHEDTPKARLQAALDYMITNWSQPDANIYVLIYYLSAHNKKIWKARQKIWSNFYDQVTRLLKESQPDLTPAQRNKKVLLIASLVDGLHMQPGFAPGDTLKPSNRFLLNDVRELALEIAGF